MNNLDRLRAFFKAENCRDWAAYAQYLHPDIVWTLHGSEKKIIYGAQAYLDAMRAAYADCNDTFVCENMAVSADGQRIATLLINNCGERSCDIFDWRDGRIVAEYEFLLGTDETNLGDIHKI